MIVKKLRMDELIAMENILVSSIYPWSGVVEAPFSSAWGIVEPKQASRRHMHHEAETFYITRGRGIVTIGTESQEVEEGDVLYFPPFTTHTLRNESDTDNLIFITVYWQDPALSGKDAGPTVTGKELAQQKKVLVLSTPPTPNGELHLGHLSGPYLGADIYVRYLRLRGLEAHHITGTDDNQTYVTTKAIQIGQSNRATAIHFGDKIYSALEVAGVELAHYVQPTKSAAHKAFVTEFFLQLYTQDKLIAKETLCLYCERCQQYLFEVYVSGSCPHCHEPTAGCGCEECGRPNDCVDLLDPVCSTCQQSPIQRSITRFFFPLGQYESRLYEFLENSQMNTHLRTLCDRILADGLPDIAISHVSNWGIPVPVPGFETQVIWSWFEMAPLYLAAAQDLGKKLGWFINPESLFVNDEVDVVQFFGYDNGWQKTLLLTALYMAYKPNENPPFTFVGNEFYRLDGLKFSTSRNHVVLLGDLLSQTPADLVRFYLCYTRPESEQTVFTYSDFATTTKRILIDEWQNWLHMLGAKVAREFDGAAPEPGIWTETQRRFYHELQTSIANVEMAFDAVDFSLQAAIRTLSELVRYARRFGTAEYYWSAAPNRRDELRTAVSLELAAARTLAILSMPIMPTFATQLWQDLGHQTPLEQNGWEQIPAWVPAGARVDLSRQYFAEVKF